MVEFGQMWSKRAKVVVFKKSRFILEFWLYSGKVVVFGQIGCVWAKVVVIGQKWLFSGKWLYLGKVGCIGAKML